jgi:hypothetical protein
MQEMPGDHQDSSARVTSVNAGAESADAESIGAQSSGRAMRRHREMLGLATLVIVLSWLLEVHSDQRVAIGFLPAWPLPETCMSRSLFHVSCPGCGLTRSFVYLAHADWKASWNMHRLGWLLAVAVVAQIPYRIFALATGQPAPLGKSAPRAFGMLLITLLIVNWVANMISALQN